MDKYNAQLDIHDLTEGTVMYLRVKERDAAVRIDWIKPVNEILSVVNKKYVLYRPRLGQAITGDVDTSGKNPKTGNILRFMNMSKEELRANYNVKYMGQENVEGGTPTWHLELTPKNAEKVKSTDLWVDGNGMVIQARGTENNNDSTTIFLSNLQKNVKIDTSKFKINLPKDTKIIKG